eukprot:scaffold5185_cov198-Alexandrium_tamarense.AAC.2
MNSSYNSDTAVSDEEDPLNTSTRSIEDDNISNGGASSSSRLRERTQRHRQRLSRVKQMRKGGNDAGSSNGEAGQGSLSEYQQAHQSSSAQQQGEPSQRALMTRARSGSESSSSSASATSSGTGSARRHLLADKDGGGSVKSGKSDSSSTQQHQQSSSIRQSTSQTSTQQSRTSNASLASTASISSTSSPLRNSSAKPSQQYANSSSNPPPPPPKNPPTSNSHLPPTHPQQLQQQQSQHHHKTSGPVLVSVESPLPPLVQRSLGDRSYDKRKNAALEIEQLVKSLSEAHNVPMIQSIIAVLAKDFCTSMNANYRKGGLIGIAATAIGLMGNTRQFLEGLLFPVLHCFDDPESRVRYYACESLYNIAKVARGSILRYFNQIFDGLTKLFADVDVDVKNGANLLDRLVKDIVTESESFHVEHFLPLLQTYIRRSNPYIRQLLVGWITVLDSVPDISMIDYLPDFLDGLFNMLSDSNREIRQAADSALSDFLKEVRHSTVLEFGPLVSILVNQCLSKDRLNRLTAITWIEELIHHPYSGGDALLPHHAEVLGAILYCISDSEDQICLVAERANGDLLSLVRDTSGDFRLAPLLEALTEKIMTKDDVPTKMASLRWINMLLEKRREDMTEFLTQLLPVLLKTLSDASDDVVLLTLQVLARISLDDGGSRIDSDQGKKKEEHKDSHDTIHCGLLRGKKDEKHFKLVINAILGLFASDRMLLENRGSLVVRKFCVLLDAESVYILMAEVLAASCEHLPCNVIKNDEDSVLKGDIEKGPSQENGRKDEDDASYSIEFVSTMVQTLNLILLTASELHGLRMLLAKAFDTRDSDAEEINMSSPGDEHSGTRNGVQVFESLFRCWCHSPVATFSLCLLARAYGVAFALVQKFSELEVSVGFLMQVDKLVQLLESPVFVHLRLQLLNVESSHHAPLLKSCYGLLMLLPQSDAFRSLNDRLTTVCNLRDNLGIPPSVAAQTTPTSKRQLDLLARFDEVMGLHRTMRGREAHQIMTGELLHDGMGGRDRSRSNYGGAGKGGGRGGAVAGGVTVVNGTNGAASVLPTSVAGSAQNRGRITQEV